MAQTNIYLKLKDVFGESLDTGHEEWIELNSFSWGVDNAASFAIGQGGQSTQAHVGSINIQKYIDKSSITLFQNATTGKHIDEGTLSCMKLAGTQGGERVEYLKIELQDIMVTSVQMSGAGSEQPVHESVSLVFAKFHQFYKLQEDAGTAPGIKDFGWDIQKSLKI